MKFIGIDLAWTYKNETGLCVLDDTGQVEYLQAEVYSDEAIAEIILNYGKDDLCVAVDAPLVIENETGAREADRLVTRARFHGHRLMLFMANRSFFNKTYGGIRGEVLSETIKTAICKRYKKTIDFDFLAQDGKNILVETFPTGIHCGLFPEIYPAPYKVKAKVPYEETNRNLRRILKRVCQLEVAGKIKGVKAHFDYDGRDIVRKDHKHIEDKLDAFLSAYGLYTIYKKEADAHCFGKINDGFITIPVRKE